VFEDLLRHRRFGNEGEDDATAAARASENVVAEDAQQQLGPGNS
jgi:hypothetical protein